MAQEKEMWYKSPDNYHRRGGSEYSMEDIRQMYANVRIRKKPHEKDEKEKAKKETKSLKKNNLPILE